MPSPRPAAVLVAASLLACGGGAKQAALPPKLLHSPELNDIMKNEVNQPFSALMFLVFHAAEASPDGEVDFEKIAVPAHTLHQGIAKVRSMVNPPVATAEAREVFLTYVDALVKDSEALSQALAVHDRPKMETVLKKITNTCNDCHHFFRLKVVDGTPEPETMVMVIPHADLEPL
ncbi:MAG TPA: hypothetical protein VN253_26150 [Kofleriaceae bacterium]|nr:hypothetical protein [Kofleriaceae bacterium]